jgi:hypothetical protein
MVGETPMTSSSTAARARLATLPIVVLLALGGASGVLSIPLAACGTGPNGAVADGGADAPGEGGGGDSDFTVPFPDTGTTPIVDAGSLPDAGADDDAGPLIDGSSCMVLTCPGQCVQGRCRVVLASTGAYDLAIHGSSVFWTSPGAAPGAGFVFSLPTTPTATTPSVTLGSEHTYPTGIAVNDTNVFWTDNSPTAGLVFSVPIGGIPKKDAGMVDAGDAGTSPGLTIANGQVSPTGIALDATYVYWTSQAPSNGTVVRAPLQGGPSVTLASNRSLPSAIAVDATSVYWIDTGVGVNGGAVLKVAKEGDAGTIVTLATTQNAPRSIAVDGTSVYWATLGSNPNTSAVLKVPVGGGTVTTIAGHQGPVNGVAVDSTTVYWSIGSSVQMGAVLSAPVDGNVVTTLASGLDSPFALAFDDTSLYWTDNVDGTVTKLSPK